MLRITLWLLMGVFVWDFASCSITCPDGNVCPDGSTCCFTVKGYSCCPYPKAVCCPDLTHCCPAGSHCNMVTKKCDKKNQPWLNIPMVENKAAEKPNPPVLPESALSDLKNSHIPDEGKVSVVHCDNYYTCPDGTTCCRHPKGVWFCCPLSSGRCCLDGYHCCPYGYDCDLSYTHCVRDSLRYPFSPKQALSSVPASLISPSEDRTSFEEKPMTALTVAGHSTNKAGVIHCDSKFHCSAGTTCCKGATGKWGCCPHPVGQCCTDGKHCCKYGYNCDALSMTCRRFYSQIPSGAQEEAKTD